MILFSPPHFSGSLLLESKIQVDTAYQKQQETLIVWSEGDNFDLALSFQEKAGCDEIWEKICSVSLKLFLLLYGVGEYMCTPQVFWFFGWGAGRGRRLTCFEREILIRRWQAVGIFYFYVVLFAGKCLKNLPIRRLLVCSHFQLGGMFGCRPKPASLVYFAL